MLKRVEIHNFRSCHAVVLDDLGPMTVLVGRNAVGKSNILRAIQWAADSATATTPLPSDVSMFRNHVALRIRTGSVEFSYSIELRFDGERPGRISLVESLAYSDDDAEHRDIFTRDYDRITLWPLEAKKQTIKTGRLMPSATALAALLPADSPAQSLIAEFISALRKIRYYPLEYENDIDQRGAVTQREFDDWFARRQETGDPGASVLLRLVQMDKSEPKILEEIQSLLGPNGLGLVDEIQVSPHSLPESRSVDESNRIYYVTVKQSRSGKPDLILFFPQLSDGTQRVISILVSLLFDQSAVMLLEHPEDSIHPGLLYKVISLLRTYSDLSQVIMSSHSPAVFNSLPPESVRLVTMENGRTTLRPFSAEESSFLKKYLEEEGSLAEFLETVEED